MSMAPAEFEGGFRPGRIDLPGGYTCERWPLSKLGPQEKITARVRVQSLLDESMELVPSDTKDEVELAMKGGEVLFLRGLKTQEEPYEGLLAFRVFPIQLTSISERVRVMWFERFLSPQAQDKHLGSSLIRVANFIAQPDAAAMRSQNIIGMRSMLSELRSEAKPNGLFDRVHPWRDGYKKYPYIRELVAGVIERTVDPDILVRQTIDYKSAAIVNGVYPEGRSRSAPKDIIGKEANELWQQLLDAGLDPDGGGAAYFIGKVAGKTNYLGDIQTSQPIAENLVLPFEAQPFSSSSLGSL